METLDTRASAIDFPIQHGDPWTLTVLCADGVPSTLAVWVALRQTVATPLVELASTSVTGGRSYALAEVDSLALSPSKAYQLVAKDADTGVTWFTGPVKPSTEGAPGPTTQTVTLALAEATVTVELTATPGAGGGPGATALADLTDVDVTSDPPAQDDVLAWDDTESKWTPATLDGGVALSDATPQDLGTAAAGVSDEASRADHVHDMPTAADIAVDASGFNGNLTTSDDTVQEVAQKVDDLVIPAAGIADPGGSNDDFLQRKSGAWTNRTIAQVKTDLSVTDVNRAHRIAPASKRASANPYSLIAPYGNGSGTLAVATGMQYLMRSPGGSGQTIERLAVHLSASALTSGQTIEVSVYDEYSGSGPGSLLWTQNITIGASTGTLYASSLSRVIPTQPFWVSVLNPSGNAGTATFRTSLVQGATVLALFWNGTPSAVLRRTAQASAASDLSSVTYRESSDTPGARLEVDATGAFPLIGVLTA